MFTLDEQAKLPLYMQIVEQTKLAIVKGYLKNGDQMPSIRDMAKMLLVNESTVRRAYKELEHKGIISSIVGKGTFIDIDEEKLKDRKDYTLDQLRDILRDAIYIGVTLKEVQTVYMQVQKEVDTL